MMVAQVLTNNQQENLSRQQIRDRDRRYQKAVMRLQRLVARTGLPVTFDNKPSRLTVTLACLKR